MGRTARELLLDDPDNGVFRVHRDAFVDETIFEREMKTIFEGTWIFLALETQIRQPHDFVTTHIGRQPVVVTRDGDGAVRGFMNTCRHRGALVVHEKCGNATRHICRYHSWTYDSAGRNVSIKNERAGAYARDFLERGHDLVPIPRLETYKGLIFGSLNPEVPPLESFLGDFRFWIDLVMEHGENGMEIIPGGATYTFNGNWKLQVENGLDFYHLTSAHPSFMAIVKRRNEGDSANRQVRSPDFTTRGDRPAGMYTFPSGHSVIWVENPAPQDRPLWLNIEALRRRVGERRAEWMLNSRNMTIFPSLQLADATSTILRTIRPLAVDRTEMRIQCIAPVGEAPEARERRIRQFEDFFNPSGLATPDDNACYRDCQEGYAARILDWQQGYDRGMAKLVWGADALAQDLGFEPTTSLHGLFPLQNEMAYHAGYRAWADLMAGG
ncbi:MAG TPA: SRPBCC family protein [Hyphomicrobiales bacterium]|nr:SRPBCC family protein [Hyphomicrobiales bacterium]